jgi:hypothetical protein
MSVDANIFRKILDGPRFRHPPKILKAPMFLDAPMFWIYFAVVYDHTRIASYLHWCVGKVGRRVRLLALDGRNLGLAGGFPSDPNLSGPRQTYRYISSPHILTSLYQLLLSTLDVPKCSREECTP